MTSFSVRFFDRKTADAAYASDVVSQIRTPLKFRQQVHVTLVCIPYVVAALSFLPERREHVQESIIVVLVPVLVFAVAVLRGHWFLLEREIQRCVASPVQFVVVVDDDDN